MNVKSVTVTFNCHIIDCHQNDDNYWFYLFHLPHNNFPKTYIIGTIIQA